MFDASCIDLLELWSNLYADSQGLRNDCGDAWRPDETHQVVGKQRRLQSRRHSMPASILGRGTRVVNKAQLPLIAPHACGNMLNECYPPAQQTAAGKR